ncbi:MAG TPA: hypothetical protein VF215_09160, partial [Thermoanaerobaculia bacterium]
MARLIEPFPSAAQRYFEEELLPEWAESPTRESLDRVQLFAEVLSARLKNDRFPIDIAAAIAHASPGQLDALRKGHLEYRRARQVDLEQGIQNYSTAEQLLQRGGSPLYLLTAALSARRFDFVVSDAQAKEYRHLLARVHWIRGHSMEQNDFMRGLREYDAAVSAYAGFRDYEGLAASHTRIAGEF